MRPVTIVTTTPGLGYGAEEVLVQLLAAWASSETERPELTLCAPRGSRIAEEAEARGFRVLPLAAQRDGIRQNMFAARAIRKAMTPGAIVHAWSARAFEVALYLAGQTGGIATGTQHDHPCAYFHGRSRRGLMRFAANRMAVLVCVSRATQDECVKYGYRGTMTVIHNGIAAAPVQDRPARAAGPVHVGFLGMNAEGKGFPIIHEWIQRGHPAIVWHLFGNVNPRLQSRADDAVAGAGSQVIIEGRRPVEEIFGKIDILVHASREFYETFGMVLVEAFRAGIPVIASDQGGPCEIIEHGKTGFLFNPRSPDTGYAHLLTLVDDPTGARQLGAAAHARWQDTFTSQHMADRYAALWRKLGEGTKH